MKPTLILTKKPKQTITLTKKPTPPMRRVNPRTLALNSMKNKS